MFVCVFFFFRQKTAYEMRISDWSSDVCSSDLDVPVVAKATRAAQAGGVQQAVSGQQVQLFAPSQQPQNLALPSPGEAKPQTDASADPLSCVTGAAGHRALPVHAPQPGLPAGAKPPSPNSAERPAGKGNDN